MKTLYRFWLKTAGIEDDFERTKVRLILAFSAIGILTSIVYWFIHPVVVFNVPRIVFILLPVLLLVSCSLLVLGINQFWISQGIIISYWLSFVVGSYHAGGVTSSVIPWLSLMPVMANLLVNYRNSIVWFVIIFSTILGYTFLHDQMPELVNAEGPWRNSLSIIGLCLILFFFTSLFDRTRYRLLQVLKVRNEELKERQREIESCNEEIQQQNEEIKSQLEHIVNSNTTLERHWNTLLEVSKNKNINFGDLNEAFGYILKITAESLRVNRVSIWSYVREPEHIECCLVYSASSGLFSSGDELPKKVNPEYFEAIRREKIIRAPDALTHPDTIRFSENYLKPLKIFSMMDAPFFQEDGELGGVLCCEHQDEPRNWSHEDIIFATSMADIISLAYRSAARREYERSIRNLGKEISKQNDLLRQKTEEIEQVNQSLEKRVKDRTEELITRNKQLSEYAFINSHQLRAPLARIIGLVELLQNDTQSVSTTDILSYLKTSSDELDEVVHKINKAIEDGQPLNREDL